MRSFTEMETNSNGKLLVHLLNEMKCGDSKQYCLMKPNGYVSQVSCKTDHALSGDASFYSPIRILLEIAYEYGAIYLLNGFIPGPFYTRI